MDQYSFLNTVHPGFIEEIYKKYLHSPDSIEISWRAFFQGFDFATKNYKITSKLSEKKLKKNNFNENFEKILKEFKVISLIHAYRSYGHLFTKTNPIRKRRQYKPNLDIENFGLNSLDINVVFEAGKLINKKPLTLFEIIFHLKSIYCESIGIEYMYFHDPKKILWVQKWLNKNNNHPILLDNEKKNLFEKLNKAVIFENFLHTKFVGQKRFSIEGNESLLPALDELIEYSSNTYKVQEFVIGMPHRGRLNVLNNLFKKNTVEIFNEFNGKEYEEESVFYGDVKYHLGATINRKSSLGNFLKMILVPNPSHLESVNSIVQGIARANIDNYYNKNYKKLLSVLVHGDAAISAQGIIYEIVQMSQLKGYKTGGTIHIVINNQIGFTTNYFDGRSSNYCTDIGKVTLSPILHVNSDDVEAVIHTIRFAVDFRMHFQQDVFIDLLGYRKYGHNEGDEPRFTQPSLYKFISKHPNTSDIYKEKLKKKGILDKKYFSSIEENFKNQLEKDYETSKSIKTNKLNSSSSFSSSSSSKKEKNNQFFKTLNTCFSLEKLKEIGLKISTLPKKENFYKKIKKLFEKRREMLKKGDALDWGITELLAYGTLLSEGFNIRISGQDVERGTFSHRHAVIISEDTEKKYILLNEIEDFQGNIQIYNSLLSEYGVMGFDYGYSMVSPNTLTLWEAQFGDFSNGAQIIIDQYLSSAEDKWKIQNGLVLLLPHGYEGQGPEHSSARIERYLQLCSRNNMFVINCSYPANFYHALRRQMKFSFRKPLIIFTPKSLLRHPLCISSLEELATGSFQTIVDDYEADIKNITHLIICSGKIYYEIFERKNLMKLKYIAIIRIEQLYPFPYEKIKKIFKKYLFCKKFIWVQEEPENMGAWPYIHYNLKNFSLELISRSESSSPATGSYKYFIKTQQEILDKIFKL